MPFTKLKDLYRRLNRYEQRRSAAQKRKDTLCQERDAEYQQYIANHRPPQKVTQASGQQNHFDQMAYSYATFEGLNLSSSLSEEPIVVSEVYFHFCTFQQATFHHVIFDRCIFTGAIFDQVDLTRVQFRSCLFGDYQDCSSRFVNCSIQGGYGERLAVFSSCSLRAMVFEKTLLRHTTFTTCNLCDSVMDQVSLEDVEFRGGDLSGMAICRPLSLDFHFSRTEELRVDGSIFVDHKVEEIAQIVPAIRALRGLSRLLEFHSLGHIAGEYRYRSKQLEERNTTGLQRFSLTCQRLSCGYGEKSSFTLVLILVQMLLFSAVYMFTGIHTGYLTIDYNLFGSSLGSGNVFSDYCTCLFFSLTTFSTVGYGNYLPLDGLSMFVAGLQMLTGISMTALWTGCVLRKISR